MSFGNNMAGASSGQELETIQTEALGFLSIAGDAKVRLTSAWSSLPAATASLLSIAPRKGLVAAAGPDEVIIATTETVRKAFESPKDGDSEIRKLEPQLRMPMPMRVSQLAFTADENYLILSAESGGGLAVYETQSLLSGSTNPAFELGTEGQSLRALVPNPTVEKSELCAIITENGNLHMANLQQKSISNPLKPQVGCLSWSAKGKQLCAGLVDGTICQMTPEGDEKALIPVPPNVQNSHVSSLTWLENHLFLAIHTTSNASPPSSVYHLITRQPPTSFSFQKMTDPVEPFGSEKTPHHTLLRLRDFAPDLQDLLIVSSTASSELGLLTRSKSALTNDKPADSITGVFTTTELLDDTKRPTLPMTDSMDDSTPIGISLDLSSKDKVYKPIPSDEELEESPTPLPGLWVMTHEGILCSWWVIYTDSIKQGTAYSGLVVGEGSITSSAAAQAPAAAAVSSSPFSNTGGSSAFGAAATPTAFGAASQMGQKASPWGAPAASSGTASNTGGAAFGSSSFGGAQASASPPAFGKPSSFGQPSQLGMRNSPWAAGGGAAPAFGQSGFASFSNKNDGNDNNASPVASTAPAASTTGGFAGFANQGGFGSVAGNSGGSSIFASKPAAAGNPFASTSPAANPFGSKSDKPVPNPFASTASGSNAFGAKPDKPASNPFTNNSPGDSAFGATPDKPKSNPFATSSATDKPSGGVFGSTPFKLESSFKRDPAAKNDDGKPGSSTGGSLFGSGFGSALTDAANKPTVTTPGANDQEMDGSSAAQQTTPESNRTLAPAAADQESTTPTTTPAPSKFGFATSPAPGTSLFGQPTKLGASSSSMFGSKPSSSHQGGVFGSLGSKEQETPKIKVEEEDDAPLPPDTTSKATYPLGDSSSSSTSSNVPGPTMISSKPEEAQFPPGSQATPKPSTFKANAPPTKGFFDSQKSKAPRSESASPSSQDEDAAGPPDAPLPPDPVTSRSVYENAEPPPSFIAPKASSREASPVPSGPSEGSDSELAGDEEDEEYDEEYGDEENASEGSGVDVAKDLSPSASGLTATPGYTPQSSFGGPSGTTPATSRPEGDRARPLFGEIGRTAPLFPRPIDTSPRSPSPVRSAVPNRLMKSESMRSVSAPGMASQLLGPRGSQSQMGNSIVGRESSAGSEDPFMIQHRRMKAKQEAEESQPLVDEEDEEIQRILSGEIEPTLALDEFIAHSNVAPPAKESIPSQVEAVYKDVNAMIDTLGLNSRTIMAFIKGHSQNSATEEKNSNDLENSDDWVLCEVSDLGEILEEELHISLEEGQVDGLEDKLDACQDLARDMQRLRAKQEDLKKIIQARLEPDQADIAQSLPLSAEQAAQQNELRREVADFSKKLAGAEEALTMLRTRIAAASGSSGKGNTNVPTVEAVMRTITKMTTMVEKRSGDIDVLENQLRKVRLSSTSREGSPIVTPRRERSVMFSPETTPSRNFRHSLSSSVGPLGRATPPRKKLSGFSKEEKTDLMEKKTRRQAVLAKLKGNVEKRGVNVWNMEDID